MNETDQIYVRLLDEGIDVWRPIRSQRLRDNVFLITDQPLTDHETWEFQPGDRVVCSVVETSDGSILAATARETD